MMYKRTRQLFNDHFGGQLTECKTITLHKKIDQLKSGVYLIEVKAADGNHASQKFIKQ